MRVLYVLLDRRKKIPGTILFRAFGMSTSDILRAFYATKKVKVKGLKKDANIPLIIIDDIISKKGDVLFNAGSDLNDYDLKFPTDIKEIEIVDPNKIQETTVIDTLKKDTTKNIDEARKIIYNKLRPGYSYSKLMADSYFDTLYFNPEKYSFSYVGRYQINKRLKQEKKVASDVLYLTRTDVINTVKELLSIRESLDITDDIDNLANRRVRMVNEQLDVVIRSSLLKQKKNISEKLSSNDIDNTSVLEIFHTRHMEASINDFFARSQLSQFMDEINPLATMTHLRRLSALGPGGLNRKRAGFKVRDIHPTHFGRICPIETPEGPNIGLITHLATYARINEKGFIETPFARVVDKKITDEIVYMSADQSEKHVIASADVNIGKDKRITDKYVYCHLKYDVEYRSASEIEYIDVSPKQMVSLSSSLIPFLEHDDANRALMGSNMQRQSVPLLCPEAPIVQSGLEQQVAKDSHSAIISEYDGIVDYVDANKVIIKRNDVKNENKFAEYRIQKFRRSNQDTTKNQVPIVSIGQKVKNGDFLTDGMSISHGRLALGKNLKVAFMPWNGYNFEDAIIISDRVVKDDVLTSVHVIESKVDAIITKLGREEITADIPNMDPNKIRYLDERGIIRVGTKIGPGDLLVGKITPQGETELSGEDKLLSIIFGKKASNVKNTSLYADEKTYGVVTAVRVFSRKKEEEDDLSKKEIEWKIRRLKEAINREITEKTEEYNEKLYQKIKGKDLPTAVKIDNGKIEKGTKISKKIFTTMLNNSVSLIDIFIDDFVLTQDLSLIKEKFQFEKESILNAYEKEKNSILKTDDLPSGVIKRVVVYIAQIRKVEVGDKLAGRHGNKGVISKIAPQEDMPIMADGTPVDVVLNPLGVPSRMNIGQIYETLLGLVGEQLNTKFITPIFDGAQQSDIKKYLDKISGNEFGKIFLRDGISGERFDQPVTVGVMYIMKLNHLGRDKLHARATGPYSLVTQQPLGGKAQKGGQRLGEMEVWALEAYGAAYTLQEMFTFKSDDVIGRNKLHEAIIKDKFPMTPNIPESFNVLVKEMKTMGFDVIKEIDPQNRKIQSMKIQLASYEKMIEWATRKSGYVGEVKRADTINYKSFKPEKEGLFCEKIFGPVKDWKCSCGKYKGRKYAGQVCERCGVEITEKNVRRRHMGIIKLVTPVANILYFQGGIAPLIASILKLKTKQIENVVYYESYLVTNVASRFKKVNKWDVINEIEYRNLLNKYGTEKFTALTGAGAIYERLSDLDIDARVKEYREKVKKFKDEKKIKGSDLKELRSLLLLEKLKVSGNKPEWIVWKAIPVLPPDLRPLVPLEGSKFASADLNDLYRRVLNRNNRLKKFLEDDVPDIILKNEKRMLQESVDVLIDNGRRGNAIVGSNGSPLKSLAELLRSKQGRFRQNLLGKRVDFSGRAVIVINPKMKLSECGLPIKMGRELFKTFIEREKNRRSKELITTDGAIVKEVDQVEIEKMLENEYDKNLILLNRAPTLHRMSIQAFKPRLVQGTAIQMHPLACAAFNADFDGDQMGVHLPLTNIAQLESRMLMWSINNILSPSNGEPIVVPSQDMILGLYYLTAEKKFSGVAKRKFYSIDDLAYQYEYERINQEKVKNRLSLHIPVELFYKEKWLKTTLGRVILNAGLNKKLPFFNKTINKKNIKQFIASAYDILSNDEMVVFLDYLKEVGFFFSTRGGITFGLWDIVIPEEKKAGLENAQKEVNRLNSSYIKHEITDVERYKNIINIWTTIDEKLKNVMIKKMEKGNLKDINTHFNPIYIMLDSGARGSHTQIKQIASLRGLMENPSGDIIEIPIKSNFMEGLNVLEFFISAHGARKGLADTALKTSESGYLTRRLVDVSHNIIVKEHDCGATLGIEVSALNNPPFVKEGLASRIYGRIAFEDIINTKTGEKIIGQNEMITEEIAVKIENAGIEIVKVRSPLTCQAGKGICQLCYGMDLSKKKLVEMGTPVGIIAAQSIGEPGTQLTMRTFHIGGVTSKKSEEETIRAELLLLQKGEAYKQFEIEKKLLDANFKSVKKITNKYQYKIEKFKLYVMSPNYPNKRLTIIFNEQGILTEIKDNNGKKYDEISLIQGKLKYRLQYNKEPNSEGKHLNLSRDGELVILSDIKEVVTIDKDAHGSNIIYKTAAEDIVDPKTKDLICPSGHIIDGNRTSLILTSKLVNIKVFRELERYDTPYGSELLIPNRKMLKKKTPIAIKSLYYEPIIAEENGKVEFHNIDFSPDSVKSNDKIVIQPAIVATSRLHPRIIINGVEHQIEVSRIVKGIGKGEKEVHTTHISVQKGDTVKRGDILGKIVIKKNEKTDITGGLMKVEELFEARHRKSTENAILTEITGTVEIFQDKTKKIRGTYPVYVKINAPTGGGKQYKINYNQQIKVKDGDRVEQGDPLTTGITNLFDLLRIKGANYVRRYIVDEVKSIYKLQGIGIHDKHIEIIVSKMLSKVKITKMGDSEFLPEQIVSKKEFAKEVARLESEGKEKPESEQTLLGISKVALQTDSWLSSASFQETIRVLSMAAIEGKVDNIEGLKENIIIGNLIPAGTGFREEKVKVADSMKIMRQELEHFSWKDSQGE
jgi:DNA-directed RNA polymerase subunit beta-beta'